MFGGSLAFYAESKILRNSFRGQPSLGMDFHVQRYQLTCRYQTQRSYDLNHEIRLWVIEVELQFLNTVPTFPQGNLVQSPTVKTPFLTAATLFGMSAISLIVTLIASLRFSKRNTESDIIPLTGTYWAGPNRTPVPIRTQDIPVYSMVPLDKGGG